MTNRNSKDGLTCTCGPFTAWATDMYTSHPKTDPDPLCPLHGDDRGAEPAVEADSEPTTLHTGLENTAADVSPVAVKRHPGTPSPSLQDIIFDRLAREGRPMTATEFLAVDHEQGKAIGETLAAHDVEVLRQLAEEGRLPPPMSQEQAERFFDQRHEDRVTRRDWQ